jgi:hypothetical protein
MGTSTKTRSKKALLAGASALLICSSILDVGKVGSRKGLYCERLVAFPECGAVGAAEST